MGRTNPTFRDRLSALEDEWTSYRRGLRHQDQQPFDRLWGAARAHADAGGLQNAPDPIHTVLLSICLEQEKAITALKSRIDDLEGSD